MPTHPEPLPEWLRFFCSAGQPSEAIHSQLLMLQQIVLEANRRMNLTADRTPELFWVRHIEDAVRAGACLHARQSLGDKEFSMLDVGSGGGVPGLVWAILWPQAQITLLEATRKKALFLEEAARQLSLSAVRVLNGRAEELGQNAQWRETFDYATARALAALPVLLELTLPFVRPGGWLAAIKSANVAAELQASGAALAALGAAATPPDILEYQRCDGVESRICLVQKTNPTPMQFPRLPGVPRQKPL